MALALLLAAVTSVSEPRIVAVFVPDDPAAPAALLAVENAGGKRSLSWAIVGPEEGTGGTLVEDGPPAVRVLPRAPRGGSLIERRGDLLFTVDDAGAWQDRYAQLVASPGADAIPVADARSFRLVVYGAGEALLVGSKVRVLGRAEVRAQSPTSVAVVRVGTALTTAPPFVIDTASGCAPAPFAALLPEENTRLVAQGAAICAGPFVVVRVSGLRLDARRDVPVHGVIVSR